MYPGDGSAGIAAGFSLRSTNAVEFLVEGWPFLVHWVAMPMDMAEIQLDVEVITAMGHSSENWENRLN